MCDCISRTLSSMDMELVPLDKKKWEKAGEVEWGERVERGKGIEEGKK